MRLLARETEDHREKSTQIVQIIHTVQLGSVRSGPVATWPVACFAYESALKRIEWGRTLMAGGSM